MIRIWRISPAKYSRTILSGEGSYRRGGRWNSPGRNVVYMSESISLSALEVMTHSVKLRMLGDFVKFWVEIPPDAIRSVKKSALPSDWNAIPAPQSTQQIGDQWYDKQQSPVLQVPSTVIPQESNYLLNPGHPDFSKLKRGKPDPFVFDTRLYKI